MTVAQLERQYDISFKQCFQLIGIPGGDYTPEIAVRVISALSQSEVRKSNCGKMLMNYIDRIANASRPR